MVIHFTAMGTEQKLRPTQSREAAIGGPELRSAEAARVICRPELPLRPGGPTCHLQAGASVPARRSAL